MLYIHIQVKKDNFKLEEEVLKLTEINLSQLWINCKIFIGEAILAILDQSSAEVTLQPPEKIIKACLGIAKATLENVQHTPESHQQSVSQILLHFGFDFVPHYTPI